MDVRDSQTVGIPWEWAAPYSLQNVPALMVSVGPHESPVPKTGMN